MFLEKDLLLQVIVQVEAPISLVDATVAAVKVMVVAWVVAVMVVVT